MNNSNNNSRTMTPGLQAYPNKVSPIPPSKVKVNVNGVAVVSRPPNKLNGTGKTQPPSPSIKTAGVGSVVKQKPTVVALRTKAPEKSPKIFPDVFKPMELQKGPSKAQQQSSEERIFSDHISIVFFCVSPDRDPATAGLYLLRNTDLGLAFFETPTPGSVEPWRLSLDKYIKPLGIPTTSVQGVIRLDRWAVPGIERMVSHVICAVKIDYDGREKLLSSLKGGGMWMTLSQVLENNKLRKLQSPDVVDTLQRLQLPSNPLTMGIELSYTESFLGLDLTKPIKSGLELLIQAAKLGRNEQEILYTEFLKLSVPFLTLGLIGFTQFMKLLGWNYADCRQLFRTFDVQGKNGLSYRDFLCGLAATEPVIQHGGPPAEIRCRYIFKYYDKDNDNKLSFQEFKSMIKDIRLSRHIVNDPLALHVEAEKQAKLFGSGGDYLNLTDFLTSVGQLRFRGTSHLLRSSISILKVLQGKSIGMKGKRPESKRSRSSLDYVELHPLAEESGLGGFVQSSLNHESPYEIASHSVRVRRSGTILDVHRLWDMEHSGIFGNQPSVSKQNAFGSGATRKKSIFNFNQDTQVKELLNALKYFERSIVIERDHNNPVTKAAFSWGDVDRNALGRCIIMVCGLVKEVLKNEPRLLEPVSPVYILGDIHGNYPDLLCFEKALWRLGPVLTPASFLFLGDYVDRGDYGVEVISYLFCHKLTAPTKFYLLRGNHEIREVQQMFTFQTECFMKFGERLGMDVWQAVNDVFDVMPLAAVIDKKIFCAHGGIPPPWIGGGKISVINTIPTPLPNPEEQSKLAWELMWSDPIHNNQDLNQDETQPVDLVDGFGANHRRGTAHVFTEGAMESFLKRNKLSVVVRAHELQQAGFQVQFGGKMLTVFSSSKYCGGSNEAACILADKLKLRTIRLDTS